MLCSLTFDFGDVPTWVASIGTVGTLGAAVWGLAKERQARREDTEDRQASQARLVTSSATAGPLHGVTVSVTNHSAAPIHAVRVLGLCISPKEDGVVVAWSRDAGRAQVGAWATLSPGDTVRCSVVCFTKRGDLYLLEDGLNSIAADIEYVDATGLWWGRSGPHPPTRLTAQSISVPDHIAPSTKITDGAPDRSQREG